MKLILCLVPSGLCRCHSFDYFNGGILLVNECEGGIMIHLLLCVLKNTLKINIQRYHFTPRIIYSPSFTAIILGAVGKVIDDMTIRFIIFPECQRDL